MFDKLRIPVDSKLRDTVVILNPLGEDFSIMRTTPLNGMLSSLSTNYNRRNKDVRLYELGNIYLPKQVPVTELPEERMQFTLGMYGEGDFFTLKGVLEEFLAKIGMGEKPEYNPNASRPYLHRELRQPWAVFHRVQGGRRAEGTGNHPFLRFYLM